MSPAAILLRLILGALCNVGALVILAFHVWVWHDVSAGVASAAGLGFIGWMVSPEWHYTYALIEELKALAGQG